MLHLAPFRRTLLGSRHPARYCQVPCTPTHTKYMSTIFLKPRTYLSILLHPSIHSLHFLRRLIPKTPVDSTIPNIPTTDTAVMCLFSSTPTVGRTGSVLDPPRHASRYSAHPHNPDVVRLPRGSTSSYHHRRSSTSIRDPGRVIEYRESRPRQIEYYEEPRGTRRSVSVFRERDVV
ncbi:hypothetical protein K504DRAFT_185615 [Pleomassaria siparia CBS 279.74]|uniref:Uncharacterized protein n=1 Tax=Pleomassaria siparia CBS 279.74 TaxID=1314801 RepID=A0A6G1JSN4_9PLEO|nr:hypothetical protein K504DRAFT_185615 [Pleomassaria siparia CBS 279.74]